MYSYEDRMRAVLPYIQHEQSAAAALWVFLVTDEYGIPTVYKPSETILTQSIYQTIKGTPGWERDQKELKARRGSGRARIARKIEMLLDTKT